MIGNRVRRVALTVAALSAAALATLGVLVVIEAVAYLGGFAPVTFDWSTLTDRLGDARLGQRWVTATSIGLCVVGAFLLLLSTARTTRRRVRLALVPAEMTATLDAADARSAAEMAAKSVPAVGRASARWTFRKRVRIRVRYHRSEAVPGSDVDDLVEQRVVAALERLGVAPARGVKIVRSRRSQ